MKQHAIDRRSFLKGSALGAASVIAASAVPAAALAEEEAGAAAAAAEGGIVVPQNFEYSFFPPSECAIAFEEGEIAEADIAEVVEVDVVVAGAGLAGTSAALSAAQCGLSVLLLEKGEHAYGRGAQLGAAGSQVQLHDGAEELDLDELVNDAVFSGGFRVDRKIWERYASTCGQAADWLVASLEGACGAWFADNPASVMNSGVKSWGDTIMPRGGMATVAPAVAEAAAAAGVDIRYSAPAVQLMREDGGAVTGVIAKTADGSYLKAVAAKGVVLATGGYEQNWDMLSKSLEPRDLAVAAWRNDPSLNTGDGHLMGMAAGAGIDDYPHVIMNDPGAAASTHAFVRPLAQPFLRVNEAGVRFVNEAASPELASAAISVQPGAHCFVIIAGDVAENIAELFANRGLRWDPVEMADMFMGVATQCDTLDDLAAFIGCDADTLAATLDAYQADYEAGEGDKEFGKSANAMLSVAATPFFVCEEGSAALVTVSGLRTNANSEVLDANDSVIPGLYALGNVSGRMFDSYYPHHIQANSHGRCVTFGYLVGRTLAGIDAASEKEQWAEAAAAQIAADDAAAAAEAENEAAPAAYADGTYTGTGTGMGGKINVTLDVKDGMITVADISPNNETPGIGGYEAIEDGTFAAQIEAAQSAEIDGVTGASITSGAIKKAVEEALAQAAA